jgi:hypothetical protein
MNVMGRAFSNPKRDFYRTRLVLARHLFVILCHEGIQNLKEQLHVKDQQKERNTRAMAERRPS